MIRRQVVLGIAILSAAHFFTVAAELKSWEADFLSDDEVWAIVPILAYPSLELLRPMGALSKLLFLPILFGSSVLWGVVFYASFAEIVRIARSRRVSIRYLLGLTTLVAVALGIALWVKG